MTAKKICFQIQTPGEASFQEGTVCTIATYDPDEAEVGGGAIGYSSRKETPQGDYVNATGIIKCILIINFEG